ncbi:MAG: hypothetical protein GEU26_12975 [Nitrososphaeraceae archaeon]|nr:hypothetical protein [Nitrososphaeraceae archaeon]
MSGFAKDISQSNTVESVFEKAVELYISNWDVRNAISQIPILGLAIDSVATTLSQQIQQKRFLQTFDILHEMIELMDETKVDKYF